MLGGIGFSKRSAGIAKVTPCFFWNLTRLKRTLKASLQTTNRTKTSIPFDLSSTVFADYIPSNSLSIGGKIKDRKENFIEGVEVNFNLVGKGDQTTRSDRFGNFQFLFPPGKNESASEFIEKENDYQLNFKKKGFKPYSYPGEIDRRHTWVGEITLKTGPIPLFKKKEAKASLIVIGAGLIAAGISLKLKSRDIYDVYENNLNPTSSDYQKMSRIDHYQTANKKHKLGYGLGIGGLTFVFSGAYLLIRNSGKNH